MLPTTNRLKHMKDFEILYKEGRFVPGELLTMKIWKIDPALYPRRKYSLEDLKIGFVVSAKISKKAVIRNRLKRQMREIVRLLLKDNRLKRGFIIALMAKAGMVGKEYKEIEQNIIAILRRGGILGMPKV